MTEKRFEMGEYTNCRYDICEILKDDEYYCTVSTKDADLIINVLEENEQLKNKIKSLTIELSTHKHPLWSTREAERVVNELKKENEQLKQQLNEVKAHNKWLIAVLGESGAIVELKKGDVE